MARGKTKGPAIDQAREILRAAIPAAARALVACLDAEDQALRLRAAAAILNRAGLTEADRLSSTYAHTWIGGEDDGLGL